MAKQCIYCGQPLPKDDARFCNDCGQSQIVPSSADAEQAPIKVKLPPRELARDDLSAAPKTSFTSERGGAVPARPLQTPPSSRLPKRPVRQASQEQQARAERPEMSYPATSVNPKSPYTQKQQPDSAPTPIPQTAFEESTMVRPGWQEELELLRKDRAPANMPAHPEKKALPEPEPEPNPTPWRPQNVPPSMLAQERTPSGVDHASFASEERTRVGEQPQRELHVKTWDQQSNLSSSTPSVRTSGSGSAFSSASEKRDEDLADLETAMWQQVDTPATEQKKNQQMIDENAATLWNEDFSEDKVEDFPTAILDVPPPFVQSQPRLPIERPSTSQSGPLARTTGKSMDVEDQLTRPMPANFAPSRPVTPPPSPRSPLPPVPPLPPLENRPVRPVSNPTSSSGSYGQGSSFGQPGSAGREPHAMNPSSIVPNPASQAGNAARWSEEQTARSFAPMTPPPNTPQPDPTYKYTATAFGPPRQKRHTGRVWVILLLLLLVGGGAFWYVQYQPFTNQLSQTDQVYQNTTLGFSVHYPLYWKVSDNQARSIVRFMDSTATGQVSLSRADTNGSTLAQYLSQQEAQLGLTGQKAGPAVTFAGATWQQVQGNVNLGGATYTTTLYATQHNGHFYMLACLTVPNVYAQMEHSDFAPLRASFQFL